MAFTLSAWPGSHIDMGSRLTLHLETDSVGSARSDRKDMPRPMTPVLALGFLDIKATHLVHHVLQA